MGNCVLAHFKFLKVMKKSVIKNIAKVTFVVILLSFFGLKSKAAVDTPETLKNNQVVECVQID